MVLFRPEYRSRVCTHPLVLLVERKRSAPFATAVRLPAWVLNVHLFKSKPGPLKSSESKGTLSKCGGAFSTGAVAARATFGFAELPVAVEEIDRHAPSSSRIFRMRVFGRGHFCRLKSFT
jgi:hypothetical protein